MIIYLTRDNILFNYRSFNQLKKIFFRNESKKINSLSDEDIVLTVGTINEGRSVDEEILEPVSRIPKKKFNKPKVVKF